MSHTQKFVQELVAKHGSQRNSLIPVLQEIVAVDRFLSEDAMLAVAQEFGLSAAEVFGAASFYTFLVCKTISCHMKGKEYVIEALEEALGVKIGGTTVDGKFTLLTANCLGWCHKGPVMLVNNDVYPEVTPQSAVALLDKYCL